MEFDSAGGGRVPFWRLYYHLVWATKGREPLIVAEVVKRLKGASSHHLHVTNLAPSLEWEHGYGVLSLGETQRPIAEAYVLHQKAHHAQQTPIAWLERLAEADEGPTDAGLTVEILPPGVREPALLYSPNGEWPF
jgi:hypothetical protein